MRDKKQIYAWIMVIAVFSFAGFWIEDIWMAFIQKHMDNRNMCLPFLLGYGLAVVFVYTLFGTPRDMRILMCKVEIKNPWLCRLIYFMLMVVSVSLGELALGITVEKITGNIWWDYRNMPLHFTPYVSLYTSLGLGAALTAGMDWVLLPLNRYFQNWNSKLLKICAITLGVLLLADYFFSMGYMLVNQKGIFLWRFFFK